MRAKSHKANARARTRRQEQWRVRTGGVVVEARDEGVEAPADGEEEIRRDGDAGDEVLVDERLVLQLLVLRRREGRRPRRPPRAHRVLLLVVLRRRLLPDADAARKHGATPH
jgi:hypothetical protein